MSAISHLLIQQARILQADGEFFLGDVLVRGGEIVQIDRQISPPEAAHCEIIDATGFTLLPGAIDPQVHFREPGLEYKEDLFTATRACAAGGVR